MFVAPVYWISSNAVLAHNVAFIGSYVLAATGMYLLARFLCGRRDAAVLAALVFAFGPFRAGHVSHLQVLLSGWMPITLWLLHRYFAAPSWRSAAAFAAAFALQALSNGYFLFFLALPVAMVAWFELARRRGQWPTFVPQLAAAAALILAAIAPFAIVYANLRRQGFQRDTGDWVNFSADVGSYLFVAGGVRFWGWLHGASNSEAQLFPGLTMATLAALALIPGLRIANSVESPIPHPQSQIVTVRLYAAIAAIAFVLSLGPEPRAWGHQFLPSGPYLWLARIVPGLDGLRVPARISVVMYLALSVVAACGAARLLEVLSTRTRRLAFFAIAAFALVEGAAVPLQTAAVDGHGRPRDRAVYQWLAASVPGAALELPIREWDITPTLIYQYATLFHGHPIVNGYSGYGSALQAFLAGPPLDELETFDRALAMLRAVAIRYVLVHPGDYGDRASGVEVVRAIRAHPDQVDDVYDDGVVVAFRLRPANDAPSPAAPSGALQQVPPSQLIATASHNVDRLPFAFDGDLDSRWLSGGGQTGTEQIVIQFRQPRQVARLSLRFGLRSLGDYPRMLVVDATAPDGTAREVYRGDVLTPLALAVVKDGTYPSLDIEMTPMPTTRLSLRQLGRTSRTFWSIHEIEVWERR